MSSSSSSSGDDDGARGDYDAPSSSRQRRNGNGVWPEPFVEALATHVAFDASETQGRLVAAQVLSNIFQVHLLTFSRYCKRGLWFMFNKQQATFIALLFDMI